MGWRQIRAAPSYYEYLKVSYVKKLGSKFNWEDFHEMEASTKKLTLNLTKLVDLLKLCSYKTSC